MATRKDLLKAQAFTSRRMIAAFVDRDPDDPTPPLRRVGVATFVSVLIGVVLLAGVALIGMLGGGVADDSWKQQGNSVLADTQSGSLFIWSEEQQVLVPMADISSALLQAAPADGATGRPPVIRVKTEALRGANQAPPMGIPNAPRQLPVADEMESYPIRLCSTAPSGRGRFLTLEFGSEAAVDWSMAFVAEESSGKQYLVADGRAHELWAQQGEPSPLVEGLPVVQPGNAWIAALPLGAPFTAREIPGRGSPSLNKTLSLQVGQFAVVPAAGNAPARYYVQLDEGLAQIAYLDMRLIQALTDDSRPPAEISESTLTGALHPTIERFSEGNVPMHQPTGPQGVASLESSSVCATFTEDRPGQVGLSVGQPTPTVPVEIPEASGDIDVVDMEPLSGALLRNVNAASEDSAVTLVLNGRGYPIPDANSRAALGFGDVQAASVTPTLLNLIQPGLAGVGVSLNRESIIPVGD